MYILQVFHADKNTMIKKNAFDAPDIILNLLHLVQTNTDDCYQTDDDLERFKCEFIKFNVIDSDDSNVRIYQLFFKFDMTRVQVH